MFVCHRCDNPPCCNSAHLFLGAAVDNVRDMTAKGRRKRQNAKLTPDDVRSIRARYVRGRVRMADLAAEFGVSATEIGLVVNGKLWKDVT